MHKDTHKTLICSPHAREKTFSYFAAISFTPIRTNKQMAALHCTTLPHRVKSARCQITPLSVCIITIENVLFCLCGVQLLTSIQPSHPQFLSSVNGVSGETSGAAGVHLCLITPRKKSGTNRPQRWVPRDVSHPAVLSRTRCPCRRLIKSTVPF